MLILQRLFYGPLRPIEVEQLYEKAWFAVTETCLAMTIFREEVGGWFLVMFVCLLVGKVWGWIGEGRVEILEQQPPSNPRLFHARLSVSLIVSTIFDIFMFQYSTNRVLRYARPNMMVMFAFEFAVLTVTSISTAARYTISLCEANIINTQIKHRRAQMRRERELVQPQADILHGVAPTQTLQESQTAEDDIDSLDIDVPGWEDKGRWVFYLDLTTGKNPRNSYANLRTHVYVLDFFKLILYLAFFCVLCMFYGMPIHIIRDVALTIRSFYKRITDFVRYRQATRDMNARYPDATSEEIAREDVCIICREDMRPWRHRIAPDRQQEGNAVVDDPTTTVLDERLRPKKLPCGHILHFACLRSWLERQQNCPTCRRPVLTTETLPRVPEPDQHGRNQGHLQHPQAPIPAQENLQRPLAAQNVFNLGPLRIAFGARQGAAAPPQQVNQNPPPAVRQGTIPIQGQIPQGTSAFGLQQQVAGLQARTVANLPPPNSQLQLIQIEQQLIGEINGLRMQQNQLHLVRILQGELARLRLAHANPEILPGGPPPVDAQPRFPEAMLQPAQVGQRFGTIPRQQSMGHGHSNLPVGMTIPPGWTVLPLQRLPEGTNAYASATSSAGTPNTQSQAHHLTPFSGYTPNEQNARQPTSIPRSERFTDSSGMQQGRDSAFRQEADDTPSSSTAESSIPTSHQNEDMKSEAHIQQGHRDNTTSSAELQPGAPRRGRSVRPQGDSQQAFNAVERSKTQASPVNDAPFGGEGTTSYPLTNSGTIKTKGMASTVEDAAEDID